MSPAQAQVRGTVDVSVQGTAASNPFLERGEGGAAVSAGVRIEPSLVFLVDEVTNASLRGGFAIEQYSSEYGTVESFRLNAGIQHRVDERSSLNLSASANSSKSLVRDFLQDTNFPRDVRGSLNPGNVDGVNPASPGFGPDIPTGLDPALLDRLDPVLIEAGQRGRNNSYAFGASLNRTLSPRDNLMMSVLTRLARSEDSSASNFSNVSLTGSYRRALSNVTGLQANANLDRVNYEEETGVGDGLIFTPAVGLDHRFSETLTGSMELGASFTDLQSPGGSSSKDVSFAGGISVCQIQSFERFCATASRSARPTLFGGVSNVTSAGITYGRDFNLNDNINLSARYSRNSESFSRSEQGFGESQSVVAVSATYNRRLSQRVYAFLTTGYARASGLAFSSERDNYQVSTGITFRFGNTI